MWEESPGGITITCKGMGQGSNPVIEMRLVSHLMHMEGALPCLAHSPPLAHWASAKHWVGSFRFSRMHCWLVATGTNKAKPQVDPTEDQ